jgi:hypothetical protein
MIYFHSRSTVHLFVFILVQPQLNIDIPSSRELIGLKNGMSKYEPLIEQIIPTLLNDRKCLIETSNVVSCNKGVGSKLCLIYSLYKNM